MFCAAAQEKTNWFKLENDTEKRTIPTQLH